MKKILILFLLLVNLQIITDNGTLNVRFGTISAQTMLEEQLEEVVVTGTLDVNCDLCHATVFRANLEYHKQNDCPERIVVCETCHVSYKAYVGHYCDEIGYIGGINGSGGGSGGGGSNTGGSGGNSSSANTGQVSNTQDPSNPLYNSSKNISVRVLKNMPGVRLVSYTELPDELHKQERKWECVARAYAFMAEMEGCDYETVFKTMDDIAKEKGIRFEKNGIPRKELLTFYKDYCQIDTGLNYASNVASYIDKGIPVAVLTCTGLSHMVTIIGYDGFYYYTAGGNSTVTIYNKNAFNCSELFYIFNRTKTPNR